jgi:hypothetical protein
MQLNSDLDPGALMRSLAGGVQQSEQNADLMTEKQIDSLYHMSNSLVKEGMSNQPTYSALGAMGRVATTALGLHEQNRAGQGEQSGNQYQTQQKLDLLTGGDNDAGGPSSETGETHDGADHPALKFGNSNVSMDEAKAGIHTVESGGAKNPYALLGPLVAKGMYKGQQAVGKYQVMPGELADQLNVAGLPQMTVEQFRNNPQAQEKLFEANFGKLLDKYGNFNDAASVWFTGRPLAKAMKDNANDGYTKVGNYIAKANGGIAKYRLAQVGGGGSAMALQAPQSPQPGNPLGGPPNQPVMPPPSAAQAAAPAPPAVPPVAPRPAAPATGAAPQQGPQMVRTPDGRMIPLRPAASWLGRLLGMSDVGPQSPNERVGGGFQAMQGAPPGSMGSVGGAGVPIPQARPPGMPAAPPGAPQAAPPAMPPGAPNPAAGAPPAATAPAQGAPPANAPQPGAGGAPGAPEGWKPQFAPGMVDMRNPKSKQAILNLARLNPGNANEILTPQTIDGDDGWKWVGNQYIGWHRTMFPVLPKTQEVSVGVGPAAGHAVRQLSGGPAVTMSGIGTPPGGGTTPAGEKTTDEDRNRPNVRAGNPFKELMDALGGRK